ncbi:MOSC domain-containing protein [Paenibacillus sp. D51F]
MTNHLESQIGEVLSVSRNATHTFSKQTFETIRLLTGLGVEGDAHMGKTVKHRSRVARNPNQPNLRQVHLIHSELFDELRDNGFPVEPGQLGENITTRGIYLLGLPTGTKLYIGEIAVIEITGLRNPCAQIDNFQSGLLSAVLDHDENGNLVGKAGVMGIVLTGGVVRVGDPVCVSLPAKPSHPLERV